MHARFPHHQPPVLTRSSVTAFTLIELLVVIGIIGVLMAVAFPAISVMSRLTRGSAAETTVGIAARTAAAYAAKPLPDLTATTPPYTTLLANGAAALFTPSGDIRIVETDRLAADNAGDLLQTVSSPPPADYLRFGYTDLRIKGANREYIHLPANAGVVGVLRNGNDIRLITPPFAIHFNRFGQAITGFKADGDEPLMVYYDSNYDGKYDINSSRKSYSPTPYDPDAWDTRLGTVGMDADGLRPRLPFETIETVVGVLVFRVPELRTGGGTPLTLKSQGLDGFLNDDAARWLLDTNPDGTLKNAKAMFFSRNSGTQLKEYR